ncbi:oocyte zinc finger protein XlCOF26 [Monomorium pharaonis]|uniref:oocyte zinc finger protein XlCOF26 n=1 Tax=Monomorium pharaonis TaxID=307658 RepID=UPI0017475079|nr:oocyte zinc finger protein XlCOF26 [Monomorium pharaonis]
MRIKTVPRHRMLQRSIASASRNSSEDGDVGKDYDSTNAINSRGSYQAYTSHSNILSSNKEMTLSSTPNSSLPINDSNNNEVINLSIKDTSNHVNDTASDTFAEPEDKLKDSFLYKIMTDPNFLKNIQRNKQKKYACLFCKEEFATYEKLTNHMDPKRNESNHIICCACKKTFATKRSLKHHQKCHFGFKIKFTCDICTKKYTRLDNLARHSLLHINPCRFSCTMCNKTFTRKDLFNKHRKSHEKSNLYCVKCGKYLRTILTLENHQKLHCEASNASANVVVYKTESSIQTENLQSRE